MTICLNSHEILISTYLRFTISDLRGFTHHHVNLPCDAFWAKQGRISYISGWPRCRPVKVNKGKLKVSGPPGGAGVIRHGGSPPGKNHKAIQGNASDFRHPPRAQAKIPLPPYFYCATN